MAFATNADARTRLQEATGGWRARRRLFPPPPGSGRECAGHVGRIGRVTLMCRTCAGAPHSSGTPEDWNARMPRTGPATPGSPLPAAGLAAAAAARPGRLAVGVVGVGRVGAVLGAALRRAGHTIVAASAVSTASRTRASTLLPGAPLLPVDEVVARSELVLLAVPDDALPDLSTAWRPPEPCAAARCWSTSPVGTGWACWRRPSGAERSRWRCTPS